MEGREYDECTANGIRTEQYKALRYSKNRKLAREVVELLDYDKRKV